jgi:uncharacterized iron-regulated membrane protein
MTTTEPTDIGFVSEQIETEARTRPGSAERRAHRADTLRPIMWRLHFIGGFLAAPIIVSLALSGIAFAWNAQIDGVRFADVLYQPAAGGAVSVADQVRAAQAAHPDWKVASVTPGTGDRTTAVFMDPPGGTAGFEGAPADGVNVYVDRTTGRVTGDIATEDTADAILRTLHSSWRLGENFEPLTELAGSLFFVSLLTGLYLWWPGLRKRGTIAFAARRGLSGRRRSKEFHNFIGVALFVPMIFLAFTGLAWTQFASSRVSMVDKRVSPTTGGVKASLAAPVKIAVPKDEKTAWKATSGDMVFPVERDAIAVDGTTGEVVSRFDYRSEHWWNKLSTAGTLFHQAQLFGPPLQVFMSLLALAIVAMVWYGYKMWWQRRPAGGMGAPPPIRNWVRNAPVAVLAGAVFLAWAMPVLGLAFVVWLVLEAGWRWLDIARGRAQTAVTAGVA